MKLLTSHQRNQFDQERKYLRTIRVGDGGYSEAILRASAMRVGVSLEDFKARFRLS